MEICIIAVCLVLSSYLYYVGKKREAKQIIYYLVHEAEKRFGAGTGDTKYAYVVAQVYPKLPTVVRLFMTEKALDTLIDKSVKELEYRLQN